MWRAVLVILEPLHWGVVVPRCCFCCWGLWWRGVRVVRCCVHCRGLWLCGVRVVLSCCVSAWVFPGLCVGLGGLWFRLWLRFGVGCRCGGCWVGCCVRSCFRGFVDWFGNGFGGSGGWASRSGCGGCEVFHPQSPSSVRGFDHELIPLHRQHGVVFVVVEVGSTCDYKEPSVPLWHWCNAANRPPRKGWGSVQRSCLSQVRDVEDR